MSNTHPILTSPSGSGDDGKSWRYKDSSGVAEMFDPASQAELDAHLNDTVDAHDASAISFSPTGSISATDVQAAIVEVAAEAGTGGTPAAASVTFTPTGTVAATTVQAAIAEVASEAVQKSLVVAKGDLLVGTGAGTLARLAVAPDGQFLTTDSSTATGLKWTGTAPVSQPQMEFSNSVGGMFSNGEPMRWSQ